MASSASSSRSQQCEHCNQNSHYGDACPFMHTKCKKLDCQGLMNLVIFKSLKNPGRKYLKCTLSNCKGFQWLDEAIMECHGYEVPSQAYFCCGDPSHWMKDCKWNCLPCTKTNCTGTRALKTSKQGKQYLSCRGCKGFEWFNQEAYED